MKAIIFQFVGGELLIDYAAEFVNNEDVYDNLASRELNDASENDKINFSVSRNLSTGNVLMKSSNNNSKNYRYAIL